MSGSEQASADVLSSPVILCACVHKACKAREPADWRWTSCVDLSRKVQRRENVGVRGGLV